MHPLATRTCAEGQSCQALLSCPPHTASTATQHNIRHCICWKHSIILMEQHNRTEFSECVPLTFLRSVASLKVILQRCHIILRLSLPSSVQASFWIHPQFSSSSWIPSANDLVIIGLTTAFALNSYVATVPLAAPNAI